MVKAPTLAQIKAALAYATKQEGPFYRVAREGLTPGPTNPLRSAQKYVEKVLGRQYVPAEVPESSLAKQSGIARVHSLGVEDSPQYRTAVFDAYAKKNPQMVRQHGIKNYDDLLRKSYGQMAKETQQQFESLPVRMSFHRAGEGNYPNSRAMIDDVTQQGHLNVFQGGDPHDFLNAVDPRTGLNSNEMFRAVHDFYGHGIKKNPFGPKGEEVAWGAHQPMYTDLARPAMTAETRGQNSLVNYSPLNATMKAELLKVDEAINEARRYGRDESLGELLERRREIMDTFQYAPQKSLILPPEFNEPGYLGGIPDYMQGLITPRSGTATSATLTHYSPLSNLTTTDPRMYGRGIAGAEATRVRLGSGPKDRTYFYPGELGERVPEAKLGPYGYRAESDNLYDLQKDPEKLNLLSRVSNTRPYTAEANRGVLDASSAQNDMERLVKEYGYEGYLNPSAEAAAVFYPKPVTRVKKEGGSIQHFDKGSIVKKVGEELIGRGMAAVNRLNMNFKDVTKRVPELTEAAKMLAEGKISAAQYDTLVSKLKPVEPYSFVPAPATAEDAMRALTANKQPMFGKSHEIPAGERTSLRLDIPAYKDHGVWVNSIHREGSPTTYGSTSSVTDATMMGEPEKALKVAQGGPKAPFAVIRGNWNPMSEEEAVAKSQAYLNHPEWKQVGYDPERHGYFYDRASMEPIHSAEEVIQIGPLVLAKKPVYGKKAEEKYADGGEVQHLAGGGAAWQRAEGKSKSGGLNAVGRASYHAQTGGTLKPPVKGGDNPRRASFLARMGNMPGPMAKDGKPTRLALSLRAWGAASKEDARAKARAISKRNK